MALIPVTFQWDDRHGECYDCGLPAAFEADYYGTNDPCHQETADDAWEKLCAICAANAASDGCRVRRIESL